jgi:hypothetical protein
MESYVISKMLWNTNGDVTAIRDEYLMGYYGIAGEKIKTFVNNFDARMAEIASAHPDYFTEDIMSSDGYADNDVEKLVTKAFLEAQLVLLDEAVALINASDLSASEKAAYIARVDAVRATPMFYLAYAADRYYSNQAEITVARTEFIALCKRVGITAYGEHKYVSSLKSEWGLN